ncbi:hypothetical protein GL305_32955 [Nocardia seriolae]|nr:hypothetical protein [Nocardia seriolae]
MGSRAGRRPQCRASVRPGLLQGRTSRLAQCHAAGVRRNGLEDKGIRHGSVRSRRAMGAHDSEAIAAQRAPQPSPHRDQGRRAAPCRTRQRRRARRSLDRSHLDCLKGNTMNTNHAITVCTPKSLPEGSLFGAAATAVEINPANRPYVRPVAGLVAPGKVDKAFIAAMVTKYWHSGGVHLGVRFLDTKDTALKNRILSHMNAWSPGANIQFSESHGHDAEVRIARVPNDGYWSYVGTDIMSIDADQPTMNLESFSMQTPESEYKRVVRHETGHTLGFPHEHMRREIVARIDSDKAIRYFQEVIGWPPEVTRAQVLTPLEDVELITTPSDTQSIMCYQLPGIIMRDGLAVPGGLDIDDQDGKFAQRLYPTELTASPVPTVVATSAGAAKV